MTDEINYLLIIIKYTHVRLCFTLQVFFLFSLGHVG